MRFLYPLNIHPLLILILLPSLYSSLICFVAGMEARHLPLVEKLSSSERSTTMRIGSE